jgi:hypothetical protein
MVFKVNTEQTFKREKYRELKEERQEFIKRLHDPEFRRFIEQIRQEKRTTLQR